MKKIASLLGLVTLAQISLGQGVGINVTSPVNMLDVEGAVAIGTSYSGTSTAPANGAIIEGNVGIGTATTSSRLHVSSTSELVSIFERTATSGVDASIKIKGARNGSTTVDVAYIDLSNYDNNEGGGTEYVMGRVAAGMNDISGETGYLTFYTNPGTGVAERVRIDKSGNVGIGTSSPAEKLQVIGNIEIGTTGDGQWVGASSFYNLKVDTSNPWYTALNSGGSVYINADSDGGGGSNDIFFGHSQTTNAGGTTNVTFKGSGLVGIGTTAPARLLELEDTNPLIKFDGDPTGEDRSIGLDANGFVIYNDNDARYDLVIDNTGEIGIGTTSPSNLLDVKSTTANTTIRSWSTLANGAGTIRIQNDARTWDMEVAGGDGDRFRIEDVTGGTVPVRIDGGTPSSTLFLESTGDVGIGHASPTEKLDVDGQIRMRTGGNAGYIPISDANGVMTWTDPAAYTGDITGITAGNGLTGDATSGPATIHVVARNGLTANANDIELGGTLDENTTITQGAFNYIHLVSGAGNFEIDLTSSGDFQINDGGNSRFTVLDAGNVGIGSSNPAYLLDVAGTTRVTNLYVTSNGPGLAWENGVNRLTHNDGGGNVHIYFGANYASSQYQFTHGGGAAWITSNIDNTTAGNEYLDLLVSSNASAGSGSQITWGSALRIAPTTLTFGGNTLWNAGNDGSGSTLDADLLDGISSAGFIQNQTASNQSAGFRIDGNGIFNGGSVSIGTTSTSADLTIGSGTTTGGKSIHIEDHDDVSIFLEADENDSGEDDNPYIKFSQDNGLTAGILGFTGNAGVDPEALAYTDALANTLFLGTTTVSNLQLGTNNNARITVVTSGFVGMGTTNPTEKLDLEGDSDSRSSLNLNNNGVGSNSNGVTFESRGVEMAQVRMSSPDALEGEMQLWTATGGTSNKRVTIINNGNVGIGTGVPDELLHLEGASGLDGSSPITLKLNSTNNGTWTNESIYAQVLFETEDVSGSAGTRAAVKGFMNGTSGADGGLSFYTTTNGNTGISEQMRITHGGRVGIGTTAPGRTLTVYEAAAGVIADFVTNVGHAVIDVTSNDLSDAGIRFHGINNWHIGSDAALSGRFVIANSNGFLSGTGGEYLTVEAGGNVGIGSTDPSSELDVNGSLALKLTTKVAAYTLTDDDHTILVNARVAITLPNASTCDDRIYVVKRIVGIGIGTVTIFPAFGQNIDGALSKVLGTQYQTVTLQSDGADWWIISDF